MDILGFKFQRFRRKSLKPRSKSGVNSTKSVMERRGKLAILKLKKSFSRQNS